MNRDILRKRLAELKSATTKTTNMWKPSSGKSIIRIVPYKFNLDMPFTQLLFHFDIAKRPILSPSSFGEPDPIVLLAKKLQKTGNKDDWKFGKKLEPKMRVFAPVVVRGEEKEGVRFWAFGKTVYESLMTIAGEDEAGDIEDVNEGRDIIVNFQTAEEAGKNFPVTTVHLKLTQTPLTTDQALLKKFLEEQKNILDIYTKPTYEELEETLEKYMNPEGEGEGESAPVDGGSEAETEGDGTDDVPTTPKKKQASGVGVEKAEQAFDSIFKKGNKNGTKKD